MEKRDIQEEFIDKGAGRPRGLLKGPPPEGCFRYARRLPPPELSHWIVHFWMVSWDLRGREPHRPETLPHPNVHLVFEECGRSAVHGVSTAKFTRSLEGKSQVFGIKFQPGGFRPILGRAVSTISNRSISARRLIGPFTAEMEGLCAASTGEVPLIDAACAWFRSLELSEDPGIAEATRLVNLILEDRGILTVDALAGRTGITKRSLQRIFREYVGVPPKWVIRRYRLHEVVEQLNAGETRDWAQMALDLGYFDQAHLVNDFRSITGYSPRQYQTRSSARVRG